jgi:hypothetical protein
MENTITIENTKTLKTVCKHIEKNRNEFKKYILEGEKMYKKLLDERDTKSWKIHEENNKTLLSVKFKNDEWDELLSYEKNNLKMRVKKMLELNVPKVVLENEIFEHLTFQSMLDNYWYNNYSDIDTMKNDFQDQINIIDVWEEDGKTCYSTNSNPYVVYKLKKELVDEGFYKQYKRILKTYPN